MADLCYTCVDNMATTNDRQHENNDSPSAVDNLLHCPVCNNEFNAPKLLPCLHSFCFECLESSLAQSQIGPGQAFLCPLCKTQCVVPPRGIRAMKSNVFLVTLQEFFHNKTLEPDQECETCDSGRAARKKCIECTDWLCNQCCSMHLKVGAPRRSNTFPVSFEVHDDHCLNIFTFRK